MIASTQEGSSQKSHFTILYIWGKFGSLLIVLWKNLTNNVAQFILGSWFVISSAESLYFKNEQEGVIIVNIIFCRCF